MGRDVVENGRYLDRAAQARAMGIINDQVPAQVKTPTAVKKEPPEEVKKIIQKFINSPQSDLSVILLSINPNLLIDVAQQLSDGVTASRGVHGDVPDNLTRLKYCEAIAKIFGFMEEKVSTSVMIIERPGVGSVPAQVVIQRPGIESIDAPGGQDNT